MDSLLLRLHIMMSVQMPFIVIYNKNSSYVFCTGLPRNVGEISMRKTILDTCLKPGKNITFTCFGRSTS